MRKTEFVAEIRLKYVWQELDFLLCFYVRFCKLLVGAMPTIDGYLISPTHLPQTLFFGLKSCMDNSVMIVRKREGYKGDKW